MKTNNAEAMVLHDIASKPWPELTRAEWLLLHRAERDGISIPIYRQGHLMMTAAEYAASWEREDEIRHSAKRRFDREIWHLCGPVGWPIRKLP